MGRRPRRKPGLSQSSGGARLRRQRSAGASNGRRRRRSRRAVAGSRRPVHARRTPRHQRFQPPRRAGGPDRGGPRLRGRGPPPILDRPLRLSGPESDVLAWAGWGEPERFGRWTVGEESRLRFRRPCAKGEAVDAAAIDIFHVFSAGRPVVFDVQVGSEAPGRFQFPEAADIAPGAAPGGVVTVPLPPRRADDALVEISIRIHDPASPHELGLGEDRRRIGLVVRSVAPAQSRATR